MNGMNHTQQNRDSFLAVDSSRTKGYIYSVCSIGVRQVKK